MCLQNALSSAQALQWSLVTPNRLRVSKTCFSHLLLGRPLGRLQVGSGSEVTSLITSCVGVALDACPRKDSCRLAILWLTNGWFVLRRTSSLEMKSCQRIPSILLRHWESKASSFCVRDLVSVHVSAQYRSTDNTRAL